MNLEIIEFNELVNGNKKENERRQSYELLSHICRFYEVSMVDVKSKDRHKPLIKCRRLYCYIAYKVINGTEQDPVRSLTDVATDLGLKTHANVISHIKNFENMCSTDDSYAKEVLDFAIRYNNGEIYSDILEVIENRKIKFDQIRRKRKVNIIQSTNREFIKFR